MKNWLVINTDRQTLASEDAQFFREINPFCINWTRQIKANTKREAIDLAKQTTQQKRR